MKVDKIKEIVKREWEWKKENTSKIIKALKEYITIPNDSPGFDPKWSENGFMDQAVELYVKTINELKKIWKEKGTGVDDIIVEVMGSKEKPVINEEKNRRTPLIYIEIPAYKVSDKENTTLMYGHLDKQPPMPPWEKGLDPRTPVIKDGKLYGRGVADDGYALFAAFTAVMAIREQKMPHKKTVIIIEAAEESDSVDLPYYLEKIKQKIKNVDLVICLDSGCCDYENFWLTSSLRGIVNLWIEINVLEEAVHSGTASGIVPSTFRILRILLDRIENNKNGEIIPECLKVEIPQKIKEKTKETAKIIAKNLIEKMPFVQNVEPVSNDHAQLLLNQTWMSQLTVTGMQGIPEDKKLAGNAMLPYLNAKLSIRLAPTLNSRDVAEKIIKLLTDNPPYNAKININDIQCGNGWAMKKIPQWLENATDEAANYFFNKQKNSQKKAMYIGEGGSIPLMNMLEKMFPNAQFVITGILGPKSNAHAPNEFLHLDAVEKVTMAVSYIIAKKGKEE